MKPYIIVVGSDGKKQKIDLKGGIENAILQIFKALAPYMKGILKGQIRVESDKDSFRIISDIYYTPYTTEKWGYHRGWRKTLPNPNEGWWKQAYETSMRFLTSVYGKEFRRES